EHQPSEVTQPAADIQIDYDAAVTEGKKITQDTERGWMRLGELADRIEPRYDNQTLKRFAADIGIAACTLERRRSVYRAWAEAPKSAPAPISYTVAQELQTH